MTTIKLEAMGNLMLKTTPLRQSRPAVEGSISRCLFFVTGFNHLNHFTFITYISTWQVFIDQPVISLIVCYNKRNLEGSISILKNLKSQFKKKGEEGAGGGAHAKDDFVRVTHHLPNFHAII